MTTEVNTITHYDLTEDGYGACMRVSAGPHDDMITIMTGHGGAVVDQMTDTKGLRDLARGLVIVADRIDGKDEQSEAKPVPRAADVERGGFTLTDDGDTTLILTRTSGVGIVIEKDGDGFYLHAGRPGRGPGCQVTSNVEALFQLADGIRAYAEQQSGRTLATPEVKAEPKLYKSTFPDRDTTIINAPGLWGGELRIEKDDSDSTFKLSFDNGTDPIDYEWVKKDAFYAFAQALKDYADAL
ncbi:hypothetical protein [Nitrospirillum iridis]|uniref:Uncharacterized protein n=1 Tax=Nitrospirillum iridis TaxID=765888 RepID=A0A7X0EDQ7_9PROT|nr:hypothetical protein [Nitrospirillum iridis]MBB6253047.1 hypothetical protein [Nitrospirillum iridis]